MPKTEIDYSNTVIYKITCKDPLVTDVYVGHTTNFVQRKHGHKQSCINEKSCNYNCKLYKAIRANGGWDNWVMEIVAFFNCNDHYEARIKEQEYFTSLNATLNSLEPLPKPKPKPKPIETPEPIVKTDHFCETCNVTLQNQELLEVHNQTKKHCKKVVGVETKNGDKFCCEKCDYECYKKSDFNKHLLTLKHQTIQDNTLKIANTPNFVCNCGKIYKHSSSLYAHKKTCVIINKNNTSSDNENTHVHTDQNFEQKIDIFYLVKFLIKENSEIKHMMIEQQGKMMEQQNIMMKAIESMSCSGDNVIVDKSM
jgi:hypothetical protein